MRFRYSMIVLVVITSGLTACLGKNTISDPVTGASPRKHTGKQHEITLFKRFVKNDQKISGAGGGDVTDPEYKEYLQWRRWQEFKEYQQWKKENNE